MKSAEIIYVRRYPLLGQEFLTANAPGTGAKLKEYIYGAGSVINQVIYTETPSDVVDLPLDVEELWKSFDQSEIRGR